MKIKKALEHDVTSACKGRSDRLNIRDNEKPKLNLGFGGVSFYSILQSLTHDADNTITTFID